ncbi:hypothetical protein BW730_01365 [Tessaracoccus aquimaris]|uniref:Uncharacterized protein n=1 Tax=Tessaracoccus aquimaris TaxID=1332264 RepID=A0A1Q2CJV0_9ACTN|nr:hypothetical protein [Tessaracoccus aquimaris]AQP46409.1 hypothetical protein BW730_01365 [Tessaracoccus aquimaris]
MNAVLAFVIVMAIWTVSDLVAKKTNSKLSSLFVASIIFLTGFLTGIFPDDLLSSSSLLALGGVSVGFIIVHLGTMISLADFKAQWRTFVVGVATVIGIGVALLVAGLIIGGGVHQGRYEGVAQTMDYVVAGIGALSGGTISVLIVQEAALGVGLTTVAVFPVLIAALQGLIGFPLATPILRREAQRLQGEYRAGRLTAADTSEADEGKVASKLPKFLTTTAGTLVVVGLVVLASIGIDRLTGGILNTFVVALIFGIALRALGVFKPGVLDGIDAYGLMMISILILIFAPLANVDLSDVASLAVPLLVAFAVGVLGIVVFAGLAGRLLGFSFPMGIAIGLTALFGFPGTMILSQEAARGVGENDAEVAAIEGAILPKMIIAGFSTVTITSVIVTGLIASQIGR